jgi:hypothetical protein
MISGKGPLRKGETRGNDDDDDDWSNNWSKSLDDFFVIPQLFSAQVGNTTMPVND